MRRPNARIVKLRRQLEILERAKCTFRIVSISSNGALQRVDGTAVVVQPRLDRVEPSAHEADVVWDVGQRVGVRGQQLGALRRVRHLLRDEGVDALDGGLHVGVQVVEARRAAHLAEVDGHAGHGAGRLLRWLRGGLAGAAGGLAHGERAGEEGGVGAWGDGGAEERGGCGAALDAQGAGDVGLGLSLAEGAVAEERGVLLGLGLCLWLAKRAATKERCALLWLRLLL